MASSAQWLTFTKPFCGIAISNKYAERASGGVMDLLQQKHVCCADLDGEIEQYASKLLHLLQMSICYFV